MCVCIPAICSLCSYDFLYVFLLSNFIPKKSLIFLGHRRNTSFFKEETSIPSKDSLMVQGTGMEFVCNECMNDCLNSHRHTKAI